MKKKPPEPSMQQFKAALKQIVSVPKSEVDRVLAQERKQKQQQKRKS